MKTRISLFLSLALVGLAACEVHMAPSDYWRSIFRTQTDSSYYMGKTQSLVKKIVGAASEYEINKVAVLDFVDEEGKVPILGEYMAAHVVEEMARQRAFRVAQQGEVKDVLGRLNLKPSLLYSKNDAKKVGDALGSQAIITGKITDIGTNIDVHMTLLDIATGEVIASSTESLNRTKFAVEMLRHY